MISVQIRFNGHSGIRDPDLRAIKDGEIEEGEITTPGRADCHCLIIATRLTGNYRSSRHEFTPGAYPKCTR